MSKEMKTLTINGTMYEVVDEYAREHGGSGSSAGKPLILYYNKSEEYKSDSSVGDQALNEILNGRQILVRVPNISGDNYVASYSPVYMYQIPNYENNYLYLFFLTDEKQDFSALLGLPEGTAAMPMYGQLKMLLSQKYNESPLES